MARQTVTKTTGTGRNPTTGAALTQTAADTVNFEQFAATGKEVIIVQNSGASPYTYTINSVADERGRTGDISAVTIAAGAIHVIGPLDLTGWSQTDGTLHLQASNVAVKWGVYVLP